MKKVGVEEEVNGSPVITITTVTFLFILLLLLLLGVSAAEAADGRLIDPQSAGTPTRRPPVIPLFTGNMASKCPKCDKTVYFGKFPNDEI